MLSVSIAFLTYEGLTCNACVTYAERMPSALGASRKFIDFLASNIAGRFIRFIPLGAWDGLRSFILALPEPSI